MIYRLLLPLLLLVPGLALADTGNIPDRFTILPDPDFKSLDEQVQSLRKDVLNLSQDLARLQNDLLTPASTKISIFVSLDAQASWSIESMQLLVDNRPVANYLYTAGEQEALRRGGVQQLYLGNVPIGPHQFNASFIGKDNSGADKRGSISGNFEKAMAAKFIELKITRGPANAPQLVVKEWE